MMRGLDSAVMNTLIKFPDSIETLDTNKWFSFVRDMTRPRKEGNLTMEDLQGAKWIIDRLKDPTLNERFEGDDTYTTAYFDSDNVYETEPAPEEIQRVYDNFKQNVKTAMQESPGFDLDAHALFGSSHGPILKNTKKMYKVSFRAWVPKYKVKYVKLGDHIRALNLQGDADGKLDASVYKSGEQLLRCIGAIKGKTKGSKVVDRRKLVPIGPPQLFGSYIVQNLTGDEVEMVTRELEKASLPTSSRVSQAAVQAPEGPEDEVKSLIRMLGDHRAKSYEPWLQLGMALHTVGDQYLGDWIAFSSKDPEKFMEDDGGCEAKWLTFGKGASTGRRLGLGSIHRWAKEDNPGVYNQFRLNKVPEFARDNWDKQDRGLAEIAHYMLKDRIKLSAGRAKREFYYFDEEACLWKTCTDGTVKMLISKTLEDTLRDIALGFASAARDAPDNEKNALDARLAEAQKVTAYIRSNKGLHNVVSLGSDLFTDKDFEARLDRIPYLIGVKNGVVDLRTGELRVRRPEDMLNKLLDVEYDTEADYKWVEDMVCSAMADDLEMARYIQKLLGYSISGETCEELFFSFTGSGRNSKGTLTQTVRELLGGFCQEMNCAVIFERQTCNIDAERAKLLGTRIALFNEPDENDKLKISEVKLLSGGDGIPAKPLYKDPITIEPQHQCVLISNTLPSLSEVNPAIIERMICVNFPVTFVAIPEGEAETQFRRRRDNSLKDRLKNDKPAFARWLVLGAVAWYATKDLKRNAPEAVKGFTKAYLEDQDSVQKFIDLYCEVGEGYKVGAQALLSAYNDSPESDVMKASSFYSKLKSKGYVKKTIWLHSKTCQGFDCLRLK